MDKRWNILPIDEVHERALHAVLKINPALCRILVQRGYKTFEKAKHFFRPELSMLHSPWLMKDMDKAVNRITQAFQANEKILVYGDYDVDGTTSVASMYSFLKSIYPNVDYYIPHRYKEGYGISKIGIDFAKENNFTLVVSLDCGIKAVELIDYSKTLDIDFVVCDHHLPDAKIPDAVAILNPKQKDCNYPYKELCGCGVGFKLMQALAEKLNLPDESYFQYLDLVATAIAADIVPITDENRVLAFYGLKKVNDNPSTGIKALLDLAQAKKGDIKIVDLVFMIAPRINAAGRMDDAKKAVQLFVEKDIEKAKEFAEVLHTDNSDRREADASITEEALELLQQDENVATKKTTVLFQHHWHKGVVGIVASRLIETYYRPTIVLTQNENIVGGSARSVPGFNLYEAVHACREYLLGYGGHFAAAGMTLLPENVDAFKEKFEEVVAQTITPELLIPEINIDTEIKFADITPSFYNIVQQMEPFGPENMMPVFVSRNVDNTGLSRIVKEKHIRFVLKQGNHQFTGIGFNLADKFDILLTHKKIDVVYKIDINEFQGNKTLQLRVIDFRAAESSN
ncbi:single-stranded-DNA-specific exonuclease RecJ [Arachidicoccus ginsenosidimutans]|uniref:single-stranded-DNA-specific exonuclease RecJ n=1 Tax=Arachidicoccus sp. BS20 TaxID=1850526 RepID=UPI0007F0CE8C|nr:single-stranded-DNA-specific exonuclease RecJ [Arachidicoccus sp. BS20]ANI90097.1 single-stranded-DNA-specific exonuclease RecJ [Arachidicoccus sp. BS20]